MNSEVFEKIKAFTVKKTEVKESKITMYAKLEDDLGVYGDDAIDYISSFSREFKVDISNFLTSNYIGAEGDTFLLETIELFKGSKPYKKKDLSILNLIDAVIAGKLDEEVINSSGT
ncbi:MAG: DUF1493 family protein [Bacteroidota bacterium]